MSSSKKHIFFYKYLIINNLLIGTDLYMGCFEMRIQLAGNRYCNNHYIIMMLESLKEKVKLTITEGYALIMNSGYKLIRLYFLITGNL
jgi:hypothetical protein